MPEDKAGEGSQDEQQTDSVPWTKYVGVKEMLKREEKEHGDTKQTLQQTLTQLTTKETEVKNLGESLEQAKKSAVDPERIKALEGERDKATAELAQEKRSVLLKEYKVDPKDVEGMSEEQLQAFIKGKGQAEKPGADMGGGGGAISPTSAMEKIKAGFDALHPKG